MGFTTNVWSRKPEVTSCNALSTDLTHALQPLDDPQRPVIRFKTSRRAFNVVYERWCNQNKLLAKEVGGQQYAKLLWWTRSSSHGCFVLLGI